MKEKNQTKDKKLKEEKSLYIRHYSFKNISDYKTFFREYRALKIVKNKSSYLMELKNIKLYKNKRCPEVDLIFPNEGINLEDLINSQIFDYSSEKGLIKWILFQILKGLEVFHSLNIIHRGLNPKNIFISSIGDTKITGFGNSITDKESNLVKDKNIENISYMAPEYLIGQNYNNKIDIWSVGVLMLELYSKKTNFFKFEECNHIEDINKKLIFQLKNLSNYFGFNFGLDGNVNIKIDLISWLNKATFDNLKFKKIFSNIKGLDENGLNLLRQLLAFNPEERLSATDSLKMEYFREFQNIRNKKECLSYFLNNLEKEFQNVETFSEDKKINIFQNKLIDICKNENFE